jgi:hypothetical protein
MKWPSPMHGISVFCHEMVKPHAWYQYVLSWNGQAPDIVSVCFVMKLSIPSNFMTKHTDNMSGLDHFMTKHTDNMSGLDHFMTKHTDTMHGTWPFHDKIYWYHAWGLTISWRSFCHEMVKPHAWYQSVLSSNGQAQTYYRCVLSWDCMGLDHFMTKQIDTMSGAWPFHDKTAWYYVWGLTISWQNKLILCLWLDHFMTKQTDQSVLSWNGQASDIVSFCYVMKWSIPRHSVNLLCH